MQELIERLENVTGPDRELDFSIAFAIQWRPTTTDSGRSFAEHEAKHDFATAWIAHAPWRYEWPVLPYTSSIDAALTLVPKGWIVAGLREWLPRHGSDRRFWQAELSRVKEAPGFVYCGAPANSDEPASPAIALCIAALKARAEISN